MRQQRQEAATIQQLLWDGGRLLAALGPPASLGQFYTRGARLAKARLAAADRFFHEDAQTSVQALTDGAEALETRYALSAWGGSARRRSERQSAHSSNGMESLV